MGSHAITFTDLACLCDKNKQCRACAGHGRALPAGFTAAALYFPNLDESERDPGDYVGTHRRLKG